jgi:hypothetical protein
LFHNLVVRGKTTMENYDIMANNKNPLFGILMGFSFQQVDNYMIFSIYLFLERSNTKEGSMSVLLCV